MLGAPLAAAAQQTRKMWRIGYLGDSSPSLESSLVDAFRRGLRERGYVVTAGTPATLAAKQTTTTIPIVMAVTGPPPQVRSAVAYEGGPSGSSTKNVLPAPSTLSTRTRPRCRSTMLFTMARPSPVPGVPSAAWLFTR